MRNPFKHNYINLFSSVAGFFTPWDLAATHSSSGSDFLAHFFTEAHAGKRLARAFACVSEGFPRLLHRRLAVSLDLETYKH